MTDILQDLTENIQEAKTNFRFLAFNILKAKGKQIFAQNKALDCLAKSDTFFKDLLNIFNELFYCNILPENFYEIITSVQTSQTDQDRLKLCANLYKEYTKTMEQNGFKIPAYIPLFLKKTNNQNCNEQIKQRIEYLKSIFETKQKTQTNFDNTKAIEYLQFPDIQSEAIYITEEIESLVEQTDLQYQDFAIFVDKTEARQKFLDIMKAKNMPVVSSIYNEDYENLKYKISIYQQISQICEELGLEEFASQNFKNINISSKAKKEICLNNLDEVLKSFLSEILTDPYSVDRLLSKSENSNKPLIEVLYGSKTLLAQSDMEILAKELSAIKNFYEAFRIKDYAGAISGMIKREFSKFQSTAEIKDIVAGKIKSLNELQHLFSKLEDTKPEFDSFKEIMEWLPQDNNKNAVYLASINADFNTKNGFEYVYIAGLTENNFPAANSFYPFISLQTNDLLAEKIKKISPEFEYFLKTDEIHFQQRYLAFCNVMACAKEKLCLAAHSYEAKKQTQPSIFFKLLSQNDPKNLQIIETAKTENQINKNTQTAVVTAEFEKKPVLSSKEQIRLNASAISTFQTCPKKYYYKNLLNLKEPSNFAASYGNIVHCVFEVLNTKFLDKYNKQTAAELACILFEAETDSAKALSAGFSETDIELVKAADKLSLAEMKENFLNAIEDFDMSGGFDHPPKTALCEKSFVFSVPEMPEIVFDGRIDAILEDNSGNISIVDYKTGKNKPLLNYLISDYGVNFKTSRGSDPANIEVLQNAYDYQIPIYYLACCYSKELAQYKDALSCAGYIYIRPKSRENGCDTDFVSKKQLEQHKDSIIKNLKETIVDKIINTTEFKKNKSFSCDNCAYKFLCDEEEEEDE